VTDDPDLRDIFRLPPGAGRLLAMALARLVEVFECNPGRAEMVLQWEGLIGRHSRNQNRLGPEDEISVDLSEEYALRTSAETMLHRGHAQTFEYDRLLDEWYKDNSTTREYQDFELSNIYSYDLGQNGFQRAATPSEEVQMLNTWAGWTEESLNDLAKGKERAIREARERLEGLYDRASYGLKDARSRIERELSDPAALAEKVRRDLRVNAIDREYRRWKEIEQYKAIIERRQLPLFPKFPFGCSEEFPEGIVQDVSKLDSILSKGRETSEDIDTAEERLQRIVAFREAFPASDLLLEHIEQDRESERKGQLRREVGLPQFNVGSNWYKYLEAELEWMATRSHDSERERSDEARHSIQWAKELLGMLPMVAKRSLSLEKHPLSDLPDERVPESLRVLFEQAHLCYLFNLEIPCAMTCGSLIEEALETRFPELRNEWQRKQREERKSVSWREKREQVTAIHPSFQKVAGIASDVVRDRNDAVHDPSKFLLGKHTEQASLLRKTRMVLANLFEVTEQPKD
jgi:hypothetical protein